MNKKSFWDAVWETIYNYKKVKGFTLIILLIVLFVVLIGKSILSSLTNI